MDDREKLNPFSDDDEPEMEIAPMPAPLPRRRSGLADEPIESGEIVERRSLVIRSQPHVDVLPDPRVADGTIPPPVATLPVAPVRRRGYWWLVAAMLAVGAGLGVSMLPAPARKADTGQLAAAAALVGTTVDGEARAAQVRVEAIATSSMLRAGIVTDARTLADMARDKDLVFPVKDGERLEVFQLVDGKRTSMLVVPPGAAPIEPPPTGQRRLEARVDAPPLIVVSAAVASPDRSIGGEVTLSVPLDLSAVRERLSEEVDEAVITGLAVPVILVASKGRVGEVVTLPITTGLDTKLAMTAIVRPPAAGPERRIAQVGSFGLAGLFALFFVVSLRRR